MSGLTAFAVFFILWWVMLFATLPFGHRTQDDEGEITLGTVSSAPVHPNMGRKLLVNTVISAMIFAALWLAVEKFGLSFSSFDFLGPQSLNSK